MKSMRIILIQPPVQDFYQTGIRTYPLGLASLAAVLLDGGFEVEILDAHDPSLRKTIPLPAGFRYIRKYYALDNKSPYKLFDQYFHFGLDLSEIRTHIQRRQPDLVGIAALFSPYSGLAIDIARLAKDIDPDIITVMGGAHVWSMPEHVLNTDAVDFVIRGEAEWSLLRLCQELARGQPGMDRLAAIPGIGLKTGKSIFLHPDYAMIDDLDSLPIPARHLLAPDRYTMNGDRYTMLLTSRGCPYSCGFCALSATPCSTYRTRAVESVLNEINLCSRQYNISRFDIEDDNFTADKRHAAAILNGVRGLTDANVRLSAMNGISACNLTPELLKAMKETGFTHIDLALVTHDPGQRRIIARPGRLEEFDAILKSVHGQRFNTTVHIILGLPGDSIDNMLQTLLHLMARPCLIGANIYYPVPGSTLFHRHRENIRHHDPAFWRSTLASCESRAGQRDEYMTLFYLTRIVNYAKRLLGKANGSGAGRTLEEWIDNRFAALVEPEDRKRLSDRIIRRETRWSTDALGAFMLRRFAVKRQVEKLAIGNDEQGIKYMFTDEFCPQEIVEDFWERARSRPIIGPGA